MPNRIFRDGFVDSDAVCALKDWPHRVYSNLLVKVDDAGRTDGRLEAIRSLLFPLGISRRSEDLDLALHDLEAGLLIIRYVFAGKPYIQVTKWQRCGSAESSRFPWTDGSHTIEYVKRQTRDGDKEFVSTSLLEGNGVSTPSAPPPDGVQTDSNTETETETETETKAKNGVLIPSELDKPAFSSVWSDFLEYRKQRHQKLTAIGQKKLLAKLARWGVQTAIQALNSSIENGWQGVFEPKQNGNAPRSARTVRVDT